MKSCCLYNQNGLKNHLLIAMASTDLECSTREAHDCPIFRFGHRGHVHVTAAGCVNDINNLGLSLSCDLHKNIYIFFYLKESQRLLP